MIDIRIEDLQSQLCATAEDFARELGLSRGSFYLRLSGNQSWKLDEIIKMVELLKTVSSEDTIELKSGLNNYSINIKKME